MALPGSSDDVGITGGDSVTLSGATAEINSIVTTPGTLVTVSDGAILKVDGNQPSSLPMGMPVSPIANSDYFGGAVVDPGQIDFHTANLSSPPNAYFAGSTAIGPQDLSTNLMVDSAASLTFMNPGGAPPIDLFVAGAQLGIGAGNISISTAVSLGGTLRDQTATLNLTPGGTINGPGSLDQISPFNWTGGMLMPAGGVTIEATSQFNISGAAAKDLATTLTNINLTTSFGGTGNLTLDPLPGGGGGGSIVNSSGDINVSLPFITDAAGWTGGITNGGAIKGQAAASSPTIISVPLVNTGTISTDLGDGLVLAAMTGTPGTLNGTFQENGTLTLWGAWTSTGGFNLTAGNGELMIGNSSNVGTLTLASGTVSVLNGTLEVSGGSTLTGAGQLNNSGTLQLDLGASTAGLGAYQQSSMGTLVIQASSPTAFSSLTVTGLAQLSGTLKLQPVGGYTPRSGNSFQVVTAGSISGHFNSIPPGTTAAYTSTTATITEN